MRCDEARQLFDCHLDGELSPSLASELHAHRLHCPDCRRELAILEVTGHVLGSDQEPIVLRDDFTDRLLACVETPAQRILMRLRRIAYVAVPLAAAAVIVLAFVGVFDRTRPSMVAGVRVEPPVQATSGGGARASSASISAQDAQAAQRAMDEWIEQTRAYVALKQQSGQSLQKALDLTVLQILDILEEINDRSANPPHFPGADDTGNFPPPDRGSDDEDVEDL